MNTRRRALSDGCSAFNSARAAATSGRFCSAACRVFFEGDIVTLIESPDRAPPGLELLFADKPRADLVERQVGLRSDEVEQPPLMRLERRAAMAGARLRRDASRVRPAFEPADRSRNANIEQTCRFSPALACLDHTDHPSPKIVRVSLRHRAPATIDAEPESDLRPRRKPPPSLRFTSSGKCSSCWREASCGDPENFSTRALMVRSNAHIASSTISALSATSAAAPLRSVATCVAASCAASN